MGGFGCLGSVEAVEGGFRVGWHRGRFRDGVAGDLGGLVEGGLRKGLRELLALLVWV